jgi:hypothetical protein
MWKQPSLTDLPTVRDEEAVCSNLIPDNLQYKVSDFAIEVFGQAPKEISAAT